LGRAVSHFYQQLQISIGEGKTSPAWLATSFATLSQYGLFLNAEDVEYGFLWVANLLDSDCSDNGRYLMASEVIQFLGEWFEFNCPQHFPPNWVLPLLDFLSLGEKLYNVEHLPYSSAAFVALRILSVSPGYPDFGTTISPVLTSTLLPTHPLKLRSLALRLLYTFKDVWFSPKMENVPHTDLNKLLQAVGDPFQFLDPPLQDGQPVDMVDYKPIRSAIVLIGFASSDLWRNHLRHSNFTSCEEVLSTEEGRRAALEFIFDMITFLWPEFLCSPAKIIAAIRRLEELQCTNTAEVVILWAWTTGVVNPVDYDAQWGLIERTTLDFYRTHGVGRIVALSRHIINPTERESHLNFLLKRYQDHPCRVESVQRRTLPQAVRTRVPENARDLRIAQACQLRRLYHIFGYDPATWKEAVAAKEVPEKMDVFSVRIVTPTRSMDWGCDYP